MSVQPKAPGEKSVGWSAWLWLLAMIITASIIFTVMMFALFQLESEIARAVSAWWKGL